MYSSPSSLSYYSSYYYQHKMRDSRSDSSQFRIQLNSPILKNGMTSTRNGEVHSQSCPGLTLPASDTQSHEETTFMKKLNRKISFFSPLKKDLLHYCLYVGFHSIQNQCQFFLKAIARNHSKKVTWLVPGNGALLYGDAMYSTRSKPST